MAHLFQMTLGIPDNTYLKKLNKFVTSMDP